ncbi:VOC family protein [Bacillus niameyensis]|uniref:VOC family protein n=1 Tax=Bacillus niameyensis TaxID=1522308 RepID=UPI00078513BB|nr:VOC family protein [Bacillus niameyensis]
MKAQISLLTILTDNVPEMANFYEKVLGFQVEDNSENYVALKNDGVRFSICSRQIMLDVTGGHASYKEEKQGQAFELAFPCNTPEEVMQSYKEIIEKGATPVKEPTQMPWGQTTAFFADPDGNIHELFC